jgi:hypothetical protein
MWNVLWQDFVQRAERLALNPGASDQDIVDETVLWQLQGDAIRIGSPLTPGQLHLPEMYSGRSPTRTEVAPSGRWVMFVLPNPNIDVRENYPTDGALADLGGAALLRFFEDRFGDVPGSISTLAYGRMPGDPSFARYQGLCVHLRAGLRVAVSPPKTWHRLERVLADAVPAVTRPLGRIAMIADAVPWKFAGWASLGARQRPLLDAGRPYLEHSINVFEPPLVVAFDGAVREWFAMTCGMSRSEALKFKRGILQGPHQVTWPGGPSFELVGCHHPAAHRWHLAEPLLRSYLQSRLG